MVEEGCCHEDVPSLQEGTSLLPAAEQSGDPGLQLCVECNAGCAALSPRRWVTDEPVSLISHLSALPDGGGHDSSRAV